MLIVLDTQIDHIQASGEMHEKLDHILELLDLPIEDRPQLILGMLAFSGLKT